METKQFKFKGNDFTVTLGGINDVDTIEVTYPGNSNKYKDELGDIKLASKRSRQVTIAYREFVDDLNGQPLVDRAGLEFAATTQETFSYFYDMIVGNVHNLGTTLDKMVIDGLLIYKYGLPYGVYGTDGEFYYPIWFNYISTPTITTVINEQGETEDVNTYELTINITDTVEGEVYNYTILETGANNTTGVFTELPSGTYTVMVESPKSMPCIQKITL